MTYLYAIEPQGLGVLKVGISIRPDRRLSQIAGYSPAPAGFRRVLLLQSEEVARFWEAVILAWSSRSRTHGEWRTDIPLVDSLFDAVSPAVDVTEEFPQVHTSIRQLPVSAPAILDQMRALEAGISDADPAEVWRETKRLLRENYAILKETAA